MDLTTWINSILIPIATSFGGALAGAWYGFRLSIIKDDDSIKKHELDELLNSFFALQNQLNDLLSLKQTIIKPFELEPARFIKVPPSISTSPTSTTISNSLSTILIKYKSPTLGDLCRIAELRYFNYFTIHSQRNELIKQFHNENAKNSISIFDMIDLRSVKNYFGMNNLCQLYSLTEMMISSLDDSIISLLASLDELKIFICEQFKNSNFKTINFEIRDKNINILSPTPAPKIESIKHLATLLKKPTNYSVEYFNPTSYKITFNK